MPIKQVLTDQRVPVKIWTDDIEADSKRQLLNIASLPFIHHHVAAMPDVHLGIGATIGSVIATHKAIIPAAVGVDIGCGMVACRLSITANDLDEKSLKSVFDQISRDVPVGRDMHNNRRSFEDQALPFATGLGRILKSIRNWKRPSAAQPNGSSNSALSAAAITSSRSVWMNPTACGSCCTRAVVA
jgi:tRNA-splicing ligase RtcB